jgi:DNA-binding response OmpR family regulator
MAVGKILEREGYRVITADSGDKAFKFLEKITLDLVITDLEMTPIDGAQVLQKAKDLYPSTRVIIFTRNDDLCFLTDSDDHLIKPCEPEEINLRVSGCLNLDIS